MGQGAEEARFFPLSVYICWVPVGQLTPEILWGERKKGEQA